MHKPKMKVAVKPLITHCDSTSMRLDWRKPQFPPYSIFPHGLAHWSRSGGSAQTWSGGYLPTEEGTPI